MKRECFLVFFCAGLFCAGVEIKACVFEITKSID